jgi:hypothetical protein
MSQLLLCPTRKAVPIPCLGITCNRAQLGELSLSRVCNAHTNQPKKKATILFFLTGLRPVLGGWKIDLILRGGTVRYHFWGRARFKNVAARAAVIALMGCWSERDRLGLFLFLFGDLTFRTGGQAGDLTLPPRRVFDLPGRDDGFLEVTGVFCLSASHSAGSLLRFSYFLSACMLPVCIDFSCM